MADEVDPLHAALQEAEHLMEELGTDDKVLSGFSIDSDDEDDDNKDAQQPLNVNTATTSAAGATTTPAAGSNGGGEDFHPLHDNFLSTPTAAGSLRLTSRPATAAPAPSRSTGPRAAPACRVQRQACAGQIAIAIARCMLEH